MCVKLCSKERVLPLVSYLFMSVHAAVQRHDVGSRGHGIRFQTVPNKAMRSDGKQGIIPVYLFFTLNILGMNSTTAGERGIAAATHWTE